jgi:putative ABC transport system permease protein
VTILDATRLERVAIWPEQWTPGLSAAEVQDLVAPEALSPSLTGRTIRLSATSDIVASDDVYVQLRLESANGDQHSAFLGPFATGTSTRRAVVPDCVESCRLTGLSVGGPAVQPMQMSGQITFSDLTADGTPVTGFAQAGWVDESQPDEENALGDVNALDGALSVTAESGGDGGAVRLGSGDVPTYRPVLVGLQAGSGIEQGEGGAELPLASAGVVLVDPVGRVESMPFLGPGGILIDYSMFTRDDKLTDSLTRVYVLARSDTPDDIRRAMLDQGMYRSTTFEDVRSTLDQGAYALALSLYAVVAVLVLVMAVAGLAVSTAVQLPARRRDAASLRVVGVRRRTIISSVVWEFFVVLGGATVAGVAAGTLAQYVVLRTVTLGYAEDTATPRVVADLDWQQLSIVAIVAVLALGLASVLSAGLTVRGARGSTLRETAR